MLNLYYVIIICEPIKIKKLRKFLDQSIVFNVLENEYWYMKNVQTAGPNI